MKYLYALFSIGILANWTIGQTADKGPACDEKVIEKISSRGLKLGMTTEDIFAAFSDKVNVSVANTPPQEFPVAYVINNLKIDEKKGYGYSYISLVPKDQVRFEGISKHDLGFLDGRLAWFSANYEKPKWENLEQFAKTTSELLSLPVPEKNLSGGAITTKCGTHQIQFSGSGGSFAMNVSININEILRSRQKQAENEQRLKDIKAFKP